MSSIEMSPALTLACIDTVLWSKPDHLHVPNGNPSFAPLFGLSQANGFGYQYSRLIIMKGIKPADGTILIDTARLSDSLVVFSSDYNLKHWKDSFTDQNPAIMQTPYVVAEASGTATWFWLLVTGSTEDPTHVMQQMIGTVGSLGSGADLEIPNISIVSGEPYRILNLRLQFPSIWTI